MHTPATDRLPRPFGLRLLGAGLVATTLVVVLSDALLDERIARAVHRVLRSLGAGSLYLSHIPSLLLPAVLVLSATMWLLWLRAQRRGERGARARFYLVTGTALPVAFLAKLGLKPLFGRVSTRAWLRAPTDLSFHWCEGEGDFMGFPSGHMAVFTALAAATWVFFPKLRVASSGAVVFLGLALIATGQHFLSDVVAGGYLGWVVVVATDRILARVRGSASTGPSGAS